MVKRLRSGGATVTTTVRSTTAADLEKPELFIQADISTTAGVERIIREILDRLGGVDILVNNVGGSSAPSGGVLALSDKDWQETFNTNLFSAVRLDRGLLPPMLKKGSGAFRGRPGLCRSQSGVDELQQGTVERSRTERNSRQ
jgi:NAD(P)-dependent dehydrogenase (short-subunit alcohol dehydrogenase family)